MKILAIIVTALSSISLAQASEYPKHLFWCGLSSPSPEQQAYLEISDENLTTGVGKVILSNFRDNRWVPFQSATNANIKLHWTLLSNGKRAIDAAEIDLGRSGQIEMHTTEAYDRYGSAKGYLRSTVFGFNYPQGIDSWECSYFEATGTKEPGVIGSN